MQVLTPSSGSLDYAISMRPEYHQAIIDVVRFYGWKHIIYMYDSHDGKCTAYARWKQRLPGGSRKYGRVGLASWSNWKRWGWEEGRRLRGRQVALATSHSAPGKDKGRSWNFYETPSKISEQCLARIEHERMHCQHNSVLMYGKGGQESMALAKEWGRRNKNEPR